MSSLRPFYLLNTLLVSSLSKCDISLIKQLHSMLISHRKDLKFTDWALDQIYTFDGTFC